MSDTRIPLAMGLLVVIAMIALAELAVLVMGHS